MAHWSYRNGSFDLSRRTLIMGVLNVTPDSFSDGGRYDSVARAAARALEMADEGADIIDIGGESTRPGSPGVAADEEAGRVVPVIEALAGSCSIPLSIDTSKPEVAEAALQAGAHIVNDIGGLGDPAMIETVRRHEAGVVIMHMQGTPRTMQDQPFYRDVVDEVGQFLRDRVDAAVESGILAERIVVDPGIGFGKTLEHNLALLRGLATLGTRAGRPVLAGVSRKRFIGAVTNRETADRLAGSLAAASFAILRGADIIRVHDVKESCDAARIIDMLRLGDAGASC